MLGRSSPSPEAASHRAPGTSRGCDFSCGPSGRPCGVRRREGEPRSFRTGGWAPSGRCGGGVCSYSRGPPCRVCLPPCPKSLPGSLDGRGRVAAQGLCAMELGPGGIPGSGGFPEPPELLPARASGRRRPPACPPFPRNPRPAVNET